MELDNKHHNEETWKQNKQKLNAKKQQDTLVSTLL